MGKEREKERRERCPPGLGLVKGKERELLESRDRGEQWVRGWVGRGLGSEWVNKGWRSQQEGSVVKRGGGLLYGNPGGMMSGGLWCFTYAPHNRSLLNQHGAPTQNMSLQKSP